MQQGVVIRLDRKQCDVEVDGEVVPCTLRGRFFEHKEQETRPVAVGDRVQVLIEDGQGTIETIEPRTSEIARKAPRGRDQVQVVAANVDRMILVTTLRRPKSRPGMVDRLLAAAEDSELEVLLVLNKLDLCKDGEADAFLAPYQDLGYRTAAVCALTGENLDDVRDAMAEGLSVVLGHSGVGKSSLLNALDPSLELKVGDLMKEGKGRHTTTFHSLRTLQSGARVVDGPGVREFSLARIDPARLGFCFREFREHLGSCRYPNCTHVHEPECAVKAAVDAGTIRAERYRSYCKLLEELAGGGERMARHDSF